MLSKPLGQVMWDLIADDQQLTAVGLSSQELGMSVNFAGSWCSFEAL